MHLWEEVGPLLHPWEATKHEEEEEESNEEEEEVSPLGGDQASENNCVHGDPDNVVLHTVFHPLGGGGTSPRTPGRLPTTRRRRSTTRRRRSTTTYNKLVLPKSRFLQHVAPEQSTNPSKTLGSIVPMFARI